MVPVLIILIDNKNWFYVDDKTWEPVDWGKELLRNK